MSEQLFGSLSLFLVAKKCRNDTKKLIYTINFTAKSLHPILSFSSLNYESGNYSFRKNFWAKYYGSLGRNCCAVNGEKVEIGQKS